MKISPSFVLENKVILLLFNPLQKNVINRSFLFTFGGSFSVDKNSRFLFIIQKCFGLMGWGGEVSV